MKKIKYSFLAVTLAVVTVFSSCKEDDEPLKSSEKNIVSFKISSINPEVTGVITEQDKKISVVLPVGSSATALTPVITVSEKATISPASGTTLNFTSPVVYTVTAENGTTQQYTVTVTVLKSTEKAITAFSFATLTPAVVGTINETSKTIGLTVPFGTGLSALVPTVAVSVNATLSPVSGVAQNFNSPVVYTVTAEDGSTASYTVTVTIAAAPSPVISEVNKTTVIRGESITITGSNFQASGNTVKLSPTTGSSLTLSLTAQSTTSITATIPSGAAFGEYTLNVTSNGKTTFYNTQKITIQAAPGTPVITTVNKTTLSRGEVLTITGQNFKKQGFAANLNFIPFPSGGTTIVRSGSSNAEGTQITFTIPADFPTGTYTLSIEVDFLFSEEYSEVFLIKL